MPTPEATHTPDISSVTTVLYAQLMSVMGLKHSNWITRSLYPIFRSPARRMASYLVEADRDTAITGWNSAVKQFATHLVTDVCLTGQESIPKQGPLMVIANHPAAYDVAILAACIPRDDLKIIASDIAIVQMLPNIRQHIIPVPYHIPSRLQTVRSTLQHLKIAGSILIFPRGNVEPDPQVSPGAEQSMAGWSPSIELFLRNVPDTRCVVAIAGGMLSASWFSNPFIRLWKKYEQRQKVAEIFQVAAQLFTRRKPAVTPRIDFSAPLTIADLGGSTASDGAILENVLGQARQLLAHHPYQKA
jgi:hypothetical protein